MTAHQCVKVKYLRQIGYDGIDTWIQDENNVYVGRRIRVFIHRNSVKSPFHCPESKWANPYKVKEYGLDECLRLYQQHIHDSGLIYQIEELRGKWLGCFCEPDEPCHAKILSRLIYGR